MHFGNEEEAVQYVLEELSKGKVDNSHLVAFSMELQEMFIPFMRNDVPCFGQDGSTAYRIFVVGKNIRYLTEFQKKYCKNIN